MLSALVMLVIFAILAGLVLWVAQQLGAEPLMVKIIRVVLVVIFVIMAVLFLADVFGVSTGLHLRM